jgi:predicted RND superfamily exporter protein
MVPLVIGTLWTVGVMELAGLRLNLVNVWAFPLIIGSAAEYGLYIVLRSFEPPEHGGGSRLARSTVLAVMFNGLTTIAGFGSLLVAHHRGVWSLGLLLVIGSVMTLTTSLVVLPTLMRLRDERARSSAKSRDRELTIIVGGHGEANGAAAPAHAPNPERVSESPQARHRARWASLRRQRMWNVPGRERP